MKIYVASSWRNEFYPEVVEALCKVGHDVYDFRNLHVDWVKVEGSTDQSANPEVQSANSTTELPLKCKNCTLEEVAVLRIVQRKPTATQKEIAAEIGKSERTVKTITVNLQNKGILQRVNGKRNGRWEITDE